MVTRSRNPRVRTVTSADGLNRRRMLQGIATGAAALTSFGFSSKADAKRKALVRDIPTDVVVDWYAHILHLTQTTPGFSPPVASRAFGYIGVALYEALHSGMPGYCSIAASLAGLSKTPNAPSNLHYGIVANTVMYEMVRFLYPTTSIANQEQASSLYNTYEGIFGPDAGGHINKSRHYGKRVAQHIFNWSQSDGGHEGYAKNFPTDYVPPTGAGLWVPTAPAFQRALQPYWGSNRAFALPDNDAFDPGPHLPEFSSDPGSEFYALAKQVYDAVQNPESAEWGIIAAFWSDDPGATFTPPGHSISVASQVIVEEEIPLDLAVEAYAKLGMAVADAFISCWVTKYRYNLIRPISYIRSYIQPADPTWLPPLGTPPFPEYTSGHSVQSGAMAEVLEDVFGDDLAFVDHTHDARGFSPRSFTSFDHAAQEAAISRLYGGIHYLPAIELGVAQGRQVGAQINALPFRGNCGGRKGRPSCKFNAKNQLRFGSV